MFLLQILEFISTIGGRICEIFVDNIKVRLKYIVFESVKLIELILKVSSWIFDKLKKWNKYNTVGRDDMLKNIKMPFSAQPY
jgi:hypothetical protein